MKIFLGFLVGTGVSFGQLVVPEKGWERIDLGDGRAEGKRFLGVWQNEEKTVFVGVGWSPELPSFGILLGFGSEDIGVDPSEWPKNAEVLGGEKLGVRIDFGFADLKGEERTEHYWIYGKKGGLSLRVFSKKGLDFSLEGWGAEGVPVDEDGAKRKEMVNVVTRVKSVMIPRTQKIDPMMSTEEILKTLRWVEVEIRAGGEFWFKGQKVAEKELKKVLEVAAMKFREKGEGRKIQVVLDILFEKGVEFELVQRLVEVGAEAGIAFRSAGEKE